MGSDAPFWVVALLFALFGDGVHEILQDHCEQVKEEATFLVETYTSSLEGLEFKRSFQAFTAVADRPFAIVH